MFLALLGVMRFSLRLPTERAVRVVSARSHRAFDAVGALDDSLINNQNSAISVASSSGDVVIQPRARYDEFSLTPWGSASEYNIDRGVYAGNRCEWGVETIANLLVATVAAIIAAKINPEVGCSIAIAIFTTVASSMISNASIYGMEDAYFSWEFARYERQGSYSLDTYYEYTGACYSRPCKQGTTYPHTFYRHNYFS